MSLIQRERVMRRKRPRGMNFNSFLFQLMHSSMGLLTNILHAGRKWVLPINTHSKRMKYSYYFTLLTEARLSSEVTFFEFTRMTPTKFEELVVQISPCIRRRGNNFRKPIYQLVTKNIFIE